MDRGQTVVTRHDLSVAVWQYRKIDDNEAAIHVLWRVLRGENLQLSGIRGSMFGGVETRV